MKSIAPIIMILSLFGLNAFATEYPIVVKSDNVLDGDTFTLTEQLPFGLEKLSVRVIGIDCAEVHSKNPIEKNKGLAAKNKLKELLTNPDSNVSLSKVKWDKFGGRIDATVSVNGSPINEKMLDTKNCIEYHGEKKTHDWNKD